MVREEGGGPVNPPALDEQLLRSHAEFVAAGKTSRTDEQLVDLLLSASPQSYAHHNRKLLTERVAGIAPLPCRKGDAIDEPTPVTKKRRKIDETRNVSSQVEVLSSSVSASLSKRDDSSAREPDHSENEEFGDDRGEMNKNGDGGRRDVNRINQAGFEDLGGSNELGDGRKEVNKMGSGGWRDASGDNRPMFRDFGGMDSVTNKLKRKLVVPLHQLKLMRHLGVEPMSRILLHGPPGCGKTMLARAIANEVGVPFYEIYENIREMFSTTYSCSPSIVFIDEIDAMTSKRESLRKEIETRIVNELKACMDEPYRFIKPVNQNAGSDIRPGYVLVIGATNRPEALDPALRWRFDHEIVMGVPDEDERLDILSVLTSDLKVEFGVDLPKIARCTLGCVGGDLMSLVKEAGILAVHRIMKIRYIRLYRGQVNRVQFEDCHRQPFPEEEMKNVSITMADFLEACEMIQPSSELEGFSTVPNAKWDDVGGLQYLKLMFERNIVKPIKFPEVYKDLGVKLVSTFLLYGPSGCGKTLVVEALANEAGANFMHIKVPELLKKYGDQWELMVQIIFNYASTCSPCILFFDEMDDKGLWPALGRLVREPRSGVYVIGAINRHVSRPKDTECILCFTNKFQRFLYVPFPSPEERGEILKALARNKPIDANVDLMALGKDVACENFSGADLSTLMKEAAKAAIDRPTLSGGGCSLPWTINDTDFKSALNKISP